MCAYQLTPNEVMLLKDESVTDLKSTGFFSSSYGELLLTTKSLVYNKKGMLGKVTASLVYPVNDIQMYNGKPQVKLCSEFMSSALEIYLKGGETLKYKFGEGVSKAPVLKWINAFYELMAGYEYTEYDKSAYSVPGIQSVANYTAGTIDAFKSAMGFKKREPQIVTKFCQNCGAQLRGREGEVASCQYCGSSQKL